MRASIECGRTRHELRIASSESGLVVEHVHDEGAEAIVQALGLGEAPTPPCLRVARDYEGTQQIPAAIAGRAIELGINRAGVETIRYTELLLDEVVASSDGEAREAQQRLAREVAFAAAGGHSAIIQAGAGTGKTLGYIAPAFVAGGRTVIATSTTALADQLAHRDVPAVAAHASEPLTWAMLKGRGNYACQAKLAELEVTVRGREFDEARAWSEVTLTGDRAETSLDPRTWARISVGQGECPGASRCPFGDRCFREAARDALHAADIVIVTHHLLLLHLSRVADGGAPIIPAHDLLIVDEAHALEHAVRSTFRISLAPSEVKTILERARKFAATRKVDLDARETDAALARYAEAVAEARGTIPRLALDALNDELRSLATRVEAIPANARTVEARKMRIVARIEDLCTRIAAVLEPPPATAVHVRSTDATIDLIPAEPVRVLQRILWPEGPVVAVSGTFNAIGTPEDVAARLGAPEGTVALDVGSVFNLVEQAGLYCAVDLPRPGDDGFSSQAQAVADSLIRAAGGRTLWLFNSMARLREAAELSRPLLEELGVTLLQQGDVARREILRRFREDETSCMFATRTFFEGVDFPGSCCVLVIIDRLPFRPPDNPEAVAMWQYFEDNYSSDVAFQRVALEDAAQALAQAAGRLVRTRDDRGVIAVLDPRLELATYAAHLRAVLPPFRILGSLEDAREMLAAATRGRHPNADLP